MWLLVGHPCQKTPDKRDGSPARTGPCYFRSIKELRQATCLDCPSTRRLYRMGGPHVQIACLPNLPLCLWLTFFRSLLRAICRVHSSPASKLMFRFLPPSRFALASGGPLVARTEV
jgi:hypothetical protein